MSNSGSNHEHALLSPSGSKIWLGCTASLLMQKDEPNESGQAAINGTAMHTASENLLNRWMKEGFGAKMTYFKGVYVLNEGKGPIRAAVRPPKGSVLFTDEFASMSQLYVDWAKGILSAAIWSKLEMRADLSKILHKGYVTPDEKEELLQTFGTADLVAVLPRTDGTFMLLVGDLKTGRHKVHAKENKQLMLYALAVLARLSKLYDITAVRLAIFQPYCGGVSEWDISPEGLQLFAKYASKRAVEVLDLYFAGKKAVKPQHFKPAADVCQWCRFAEKCNARAKAAVAFGGESATDEDLGAEDSAPGEMTMAQLKAEYDRLPELRQHIAATEKAVYAALHAGKKVPGLKLVAGSEGNRSWEDADKVRALLLEQRRISEELISTKPGLLSVAAMEKVLKDEYPRPWAKVQALISRKPASPVVTDENDDRPEWQAATDEDLS